MGHPIEQTYSLLFKAYTLERSLLKIAMYFLEQHYNSKTMRHPPNGKSYSVFQKIL